MRAFLGWLRGEKCHCSMVAIPTVEEEDARRPSRERGNLVTEQTRIVNQIKAVLTRFGIRTFRPTLRKAEEKLEGLRTAEGARLLENTRAELRRHLARLCVVREQIHAIEHDCEVVLIHDRLRGQRDGTPQVIERRLHGAGFGIEQTNLRFDRAERGIVLLEIE